ncbi:MAG: hypothetical protein IJT25_01405 [Clostridia bacterium]|nr:hypothetical protein [Clostridia bacterium]
MVYNKTKRGLEKAAGIVGTVASSLEILGLFIYEIIFISAIINFSGPVKVGEIVVTSAEMLAPYVIAILLPLAFSICCLIFSAKVIKSPVLADGRVLNRKGTRIAMLVFSLLSGHLVSAGLMIAVLCLKDLVNPSQTVSGNIVGQSAPQANSLDTKVAELKHLKELGVISEEQYNTAINRVIEGLR